ncbi:radical SAM protein [Candidatus Dojkabacteria bacterium]|uniref:Radical SAM protein n=1 Tax=Candidatus Dojkabacteria bacterium TaxID=2099670 RepID=A0A955I5P2_9BACT|nr:radical SAM protein [Candidatus Dojkabacteria bacterium]
MAYTVRTTQVKTILSKSGLPDADWTINPYMGCRFGCKYCYAAFVGRFRHPDEEWGEYVDVKENAPQLLRKELGRKLKETKDIGTIFFSSITDPYQGLEAQYKLTRGCLEVLLEADYQGMISILTKSALVTRDIDLFPQFANLEVGMTITSTGDPISKYLETYASPHEERLKSLEKLSEAGINTYAFIGPLLPHFVWQEAEMRDLLQRIKDAGVQYVYMEHLNINAPIKKRLFEHLEKDHPELVEKFQQADSEEYRAKLDEMMHRLLKEVGLPLAHERVIYHQDKGSWDKLAHGPKP